MFFHRFFPYFPLLISVEDVENSVHNLKTKVYGFSNLKSLETRDFTFS